MSDCEFMPSLQPGPSKSLLEGLGNPNPPNLCCASHFLQQLMTDEGLGRVYIMNNTLTHAPMS